MNDTNIIQSPGSDHDLLIRMDEKLNGINSAITGLGSTVEKHETRITLQEKHSERQDGAIGALKWALGIFFTATAIGVPLMMWWAGK
jgi:hypothetical protein